MRNSFYFNANIIVFNLGFSHPDVFNCLFGSHSVPSSASQTCPETQSGNTTEEKTALMYQRSFGKPNPINRANYVHWPKVTQIKHIKPPESVLNWL